MKRKSPLCYTVVTEANLINRLRQEEEEEEEDTRFGHTHCTGAVGAESVRLN
jgi:hypothetical protein